MVYCSGNFSGEEAARDLRGGTIPAKTLPGEKEVGAEFGALVILLYSKGHCSKTLIAETLHISYEDVTRLIRRPWVGLCSSENPNDPWKALRTLYKAI